MKVTDSTNPAAQAIDAADPSSQTSRFMPRPWRRFYVTLLRGLLVLNPGLANCVVHAQASYPDRMITIVVPYPAGGTTDMLARSVADVLRRRSGQNVVVDNQPGAGGSLAGRRVISATPDGYTLLMTSSGINVCVRPSHLELKRNGGNDRVHVT